MKFYEIFTHPLWRVGYVILRLKDETRKHAFCHKGLFLSIKVWKYSFRKSKGRYKKTKMSCNLSVIYE